MAVHLPRAAKFGLAIGGALALGAVVFGVWLRPETAAQRAERMLRLAANGDGKALYPLLNREELAIYGLDATKFEQLLTHYVLPYHNGSYRFQSPPIGDGTGGFVVRELVFDPPKPTGVAWVASVAVGDKGLKPVGQFVRPLILSTWVSKYAKPGDADPRIAMLRGALAEGPALERFGVMGLDEANEGKVMRWPEVAARFRKRLEMKKIPFEG